MGRPRHGSRVRRRGGRAVREDQDGLHLVQPRLRLRLRRGPGQEGLSPDAASPLECGSGASAFTRGIARVQAAGTIGNRDPADPCPSKSGSLASALQRKRPRGIRDAPGPWCSRSRSGLFLDPEDRVAAGAGLVDGREGVLGLGLGGAGLGGELGQGVSFLDEVVHQLVPLVDGLLGLLDRLGHRLRFLRGGDDGLGGGRDVLGVLLPGRGGAGRLADLVGVLLDLLHQLGERGVVVGGVAQAGGAQGDGEHRGQQHGQLARHGRRAPRIAIREFTAGDAGRREGWASPRRAMILGERNACGSVPRIRTPRRRIKRPVAPERTDATTFPSPNSGRWMPRWACVG